MLKKAITYTDFNGEELTEDFYFNLTKAELIELEMGFDGGLSEGLKKIVASKDGNAIMQEFKRIILTSYGQRTDDGKRFVKNQTLRDEFESTEAYSVLFVEIVTDPDKAADFVRGIMPQDLIAQAQLTMEGLVSDVEPIPAEEGQAYEAKDPKVISLEESKAMDVAQLQTGLNSGDLKIRLTTAELDELPGSELANGIHQGYYVLEPPQLH